MELERSTEVGPEVPYTDEEEVSDLIVEIEALLGEYLERSLPKYLRARTQDLHKRLQRNLVDVLLH